MKKATVSVIFISFLLMCSCSAQTAPEKINVNRIFSARMTLHYNETAYTADFVCDENGCSAVFLSPKEIDGLKVETDGNTCTYSLDSLEFKASVNKKQNLPIDAIYSAVKAQIQSVQKTESGYTISGNTDYGRYIMNINNNYIPQFIEINDEELTVKFTDIT